MQDSHNSERDELFQNLSSAVQEIQGRVAQGYSVIWNCSAVDKLCFCMEDVFNHGLKEGLLSWASSNQVSFWSLANNITCKKDIEDIKRLQLKCEQEKCLAWIRQGLKENTLGSYINVITQDEKLLREFYHSHAFFCDQEKAEKVRDLIMYGISHLDFDISLSSSSKRLVARKDNPAMIAADAMITRLPERSSTVNGSASPSSSWNGHEHDTNWQDQESSTLKSEQTGKKRKKKKKAGVAMIADTEEAHCTDKVIQMHRELDLHDFNQKFKTCDNENGIEGTSENSKLVNNILNSALDAEDTSSEISLTMELPVSEIVSEKFEEPSRTINQTEDALANALTTEEITTNDYLLEEKICLDEDVVNTTVERSEEKECMGMNTEENKELDANCISDHNTSYEASCFAERSCEADTHVVNIPVVENRSSSLNPFEDSGDDESDAVDGVTEKDDNTSESETPEHFASLATFECGTPKQVDSIQEIEKERALSNVSYEGEDFNIIPGIHKDSVSGSSGSFNGSGSFSQRSSRNNTLDSIPRSSTFGSSVASGSWPNRSGSFNHNYSKVEAGFSVGSSGSELSEYEMFDELLGLEEDHFSPPESFMGFSTSEELKHAITACKDMINAASEDTEEKNKLINKLVQLRLKLQDTQDSKTENETNAKKILSHLFVKEDDPGKKSHCDKCGKAIWMWQSLYTCNACNYHSHRRCLELIRRPCASRKVSVSKYNLRICPETGMSSQQYKCAECRKQIGLTRGERSEARLCDYSGQYFCEECHWNDMVVIPARVVHNWDFSTYKVSRQWKQFLDLMLTRPLLKIEKLNPELFKFVVELREIKRLREEILIMKKYLVTCREALERKLLLQLKEKQHFVDSDNIYSLQDLIDINSGSLLAFLTKTHSVFFTHIKEECELCEAKGFVCEICGKDEVIFAFDPHAAQCNECRAVYHKSCFKAGVCPKCERRQKKSFKS